MNASHRFQRRIALAAVSLALATFCPASLVINELDADQSGTDTAEFVELYNTDGTAMALDGYFLLLVNGSTDRAYTVFDLAGKFTTATGFYVIGNSGVANANQTGAANFLQNGTTTDTNAEGDAIFLCQGSPAGIVVTPSASATLLSALPGGITIVDGLVYDGGNAVSLNDTGLLISSVGLAGQSQVFDPQVGSIGRSPDGGAANTLSLFQIFTTPSPGTLNVPSATLTLTLLPTTTAEGTTVAATVTRTGSTTAAVTVALTTSDFTEATAPATVLIPAGAASASFSVSAVDDLWIDGSQSATLQVASPGYVSGSAVLTVTDNDMTAPALVINEIYVTGTSDANGDGFTGSVAARSNDEFIEILNTGATRIDLGGYTLWEKVQTTARHTFPTGTVLAPGCAILVFGGGTFTEGTVAGRFGTAEAQKANAAASGLSLLDTGNIISLRTHTDQEIAGYTYPDQTGRPDSLTRSPDGTGALVSHTVASGALVSLSAGLRTDGVAPFCSITAGLSLSVSPATIVENAGAAAAQLTISIPSALGVPLTVRGVVSSDLTEAAPASVSAVIPVGQLSVSVAIHAINDLAQDGTQSVTLSAVASGYLNGQTSLSVTDDGHDAPPTGVWINEIDSDQPNTDTGEFIELYIGENARRSLEGYIVVLFNGSTDTAYLTYDLAGQTTDDHGYFVLGAPTVPNVTLSPSGFNLQNGADAIAVYQAAASAFPVGAAMTLTGLKDVVVYGNANADDTGLISGLGALGQLNEGSGNNVLSISRRPDATAAPTALSAYVSQAPTPGRSNVTGSGYPTWAVGHSGLGASGDDPDGDGLTNAQEYAYGGNPLQPSSSAWPTVSHTGAGQPIITIAKGPSADLDPSLVYRVLVSTDLSSPAWNTTDLTILADTPSTLVVQYTGTAPRIFLRGTVSVPSSF
jgi:Lamin Tail Domain